MLLKMETLARIQAGEVDRAYRKWLKPTVKSGGQLHTALGLLQIHAVQQIEMDEITDENCRLAGYSHKKALIEMLEKKKSGYVYEIRFEWLGVDPRVALREKTDLSIEEMDRLLKKLERWDRSKQYPGWTHSVLRIIRDHPEKRAQELADMLGMEKSWFKPSVRKLKNLGLTMSLKVGYRLSPRGQVVLDKIKQNS